MKASPFIVFCSALIPAILAVVVWSVFTGHIGPWYMYFSLGLTTGLLMNALFLVATRRNPYP